MNQVKIHHPAPQNHLPAHEQAARQQRRRAEHLPAVPGYRKPRQPRAPIHTGRKTIDTRVTNCPYKFETGS